MSATVSSPSDVLNQPPPMPDYNAYAAHLALREGVQREGAGWADERLLALGAAGRRAETCASWAAWRTRTRRSCAPTTATGTASTRSSSIRPGTSCWARDGPRAPRPPLGRAAARRARRPRRRCSMTWNVEAGHGCPISMTYSAVPALRKDPEIAAEWEPRMDGATATTSASSPRAEKDSVLFGMAMTEKQGGSDVRANITRAEPHRRRAPSTRSPATSGSARPRCATPSWYSPRPRAA